VIWILLVVIAVVGGVAAVGAFGSRKQLAAGQAQQKALATGSKERTLEDVRVDDIVTIDHKDYVCEGVIHYDEDGHRWIGGRCVDNQVIKWLIVGLERAGSGATRLLEQDNDTQITGYPPEAIVVGELRYALDKRGTATCQLDGDTGGLGDLKAGRPEGHVERCRWWLYSAPGDDTLVVEQWGSDYRVLRGKKVHDGTIELMQAS
jgi:type II secretory pathway pseudopilin PulG